LARELISVADNLERALENMAPDMQADPATGDSVGELASGVQLVYDELVTALERAGVESYEPLGEQFDPEWHEAMMTQPVSPADDGKVLDVLEKGYRLDGQVLRPARVAVGKANAQADGVSS
jgi:molecular chaperone GrpE